MTKVVSWTWGRILAVGVVCLVLGASAVLAAPGAGMGGGVSHKPAGASPWSLLSDWLGFFEEQGWGFFSSPSGVPHDDDPGPIESESVYGSGSDDSGPVGSGFEEESTVPPEYKDPPDG